MLKFTKKHPIITAGVLYLIIFIVGYMLFFSSSEYLYSEETDIHNFTYPILLDLREFYYGLFSGEASQINFDRLFGIDNILMTGYLGNPLYLPVIFFPGDSLLYFYKFSFLAQLFFAGAAFIYMSAEMGRSPVAAAAVTPLYLYCPFIMSFGISFNCYTPNLIFLPLMITGMERVFGKKSGKLLLITAFFTCLCGGLYFFIYNVALTVIYAFIRVIFMKEDSFGKRLLSFGSKGAACVITGFMLAGVLMLPQIMGVLYSGRVSSADNDVLSKIISFNSQEFFDIFCENESYVSLGFLQCVLVMIFLISRRSDKMLKLLLALCFAGICFPLMSAAFNAFTYIEHRWYYGAALLTAFAALNAICELPELSKTERILSASALLISMPGADHYFAKISVISALLIVFAANIPPVYAFLDKRIKETDSRRSNITELIIIVISVLTALFIMLLAMGDTDTVLKCVLYLSAIVIITTVGRGIRAYHYPLAAAAACIGAYFSQLSVISDLEAPTASRDIYLPLRQISDELADTEEAPIRFDCISDQDHRNYGPSYGIANNSAMFSILPGRYMTMMERSCFDRSTLNAVDCVIGFDSRIPFLTVFGIDFIQLLDMNRDLQNQSNADTERNKDPENEILFGFERFGEYTANGNKYTVYKNSYALPFGFTYNNIIRESERVQQNGADYGTSMLYGAAVEDEIAQSIPLECISPPTNKAGFSMTKSSKTLGLNDDRYFTYEIELDEVITDSEIYLNLIGVPHDDIYGTFTAQVDSGTVSTATVYSGISSDFKWAAKLDDYTIRIGNVKGKPVSRITVVSSLDIDDFEISVLPHEEFLDRFNELNEFTMKNVYLGADTLSGEITVPDTRMLVMSLQYSENWTAYDNGSRVSTYPVNDCMTGILLSQGSHCIELRYENKSLYMGAVLSGVGLIAAFILREIELHSEVTTKKRKKK